MALDIDLLFNASIIKAKEEKNEFKIILSRLENKMCDSSWKLCQQICIELFDTEVTYLLQLEILIQHFIHPFIKNGLLPGIAFEQIFGNILQLYNINKELLNVIKRNPKNISSAFTTFAPYLKLYSIYAYGYKKGLETLEDLQKKNRKLDEFVRKQQTRPEVGASLISLLIAPIQRVPRYRLLLQSLVNHSNPQHPDHLQMRDALEKVEETAEHINRLITEAEEGEALVSLARRLGNQGSSLVIPGRKILKEGLVKKTGKASGLSQQRYLVLFTDALLVCKGGMKGPLTAGRLLLLHHISVEPALGTALFKISYEEDVMLLLASTSEQGTEWLETIKDAKQKHEVCRRTLRKDNSKRPLRQRRRAGVTNTAAAIVQKARRVYQSGTKTSCLSRLKRLKTSTTK